MIDLSIIIVNWNTKELLRNCIKSITVQTRKYSYDIWVVDNNSPDHSGEMIRTEFPQIRLISNKNNNGFAKANNQALKLARSKYYLLLNPDTLITENAIDKMIDYMEETKTHVLTCKLLNEDNSLQKTVNDFFSLTKSFIENRFFAELFKNTNSKGKKLTSYWDHNSIREIDWAHGAVIMLSDYALNKVGLLDERFFIYAEEMDYYMRIRKAGLKSIYHPEIKMIHFGKSSSRQRRAEMFILNYKSFYLFLKKHYPGYVYVLYRLRTLIYLNIWLAKFGIDFLIHKMKFSDNLESLTQLKVYGKTLQWHFKRESLIAD
jgi:GT2 family glycosyltransferase